MSDPDPRPSGGTSADQALSNVLARSYGNLTRRSFLSILTRRLIALAGVPLAAQVFPYFAGEARADIYCGLHGYLCGTGNCSGGSAGASWVQCCEAAACPPGTYMCCSYTDYCGTRPQNWGAGCGGNYQQGSQAWCGQASGVYICTSVTCSGGHPSLFSCQQNCEVPIVEVCN